MNKYTSKQLKYDLLLLIIIVVWGVNFPILKHVLEVMHPFVINIFRFTASILAILFIYALQKNSFLNWGVIKSRFFSFLLLGLLGYFLYQLFFILGINNTTAGNSAIIMASSPVWTAVVAITFYKEKLTRAAWIGLVLSVAGAIYVSLSGENRISLNRDLIIGNTLILAASICWGAYTAFSKPATQFIDAKGITLIGLIISFPFNLLLAIPHMDDIMWGELNWLFWLAIVYSGALSTGLAVVAWTYSVQKVGATHTAVFGNLVPFVALVASYFILQEHIQPDQLLGGSLIVGGLILMRLNR